MMQQGLKAALDGGARFVPGESDDAPAGGGQRGVSGAVVFERGSGAVGVPAVEFDDEVVRRPAQVDLEAWVVGGGEGLVDQGLWQARVAYEGQEPGLELAAGPLGVLAGDRFGQGPGSPVPVRPC
jgi:hypothetical protein